MNILRKYELIRFFFSLSHLPVQKNSQVKLSFVCMCVFIAFLFFFFQLLIFLSFIEMLTFYFCIAMKSYDFNSEDIIILKMKYYCLNTEGSTFI